MKSSVVICGVGVEVGAKVRVGREGVRAKVGLAGKAGAVVEAGVFGDGDEVNALVAVGEMVERRGGGSCGVEPGWQATASNRRKKQR